MTPTAKQHLPRARARDRLSGMEQHSLLRTGGEPVKILGHLAAAVDSTPGSPKQEARRYVWYNLRVYSAGVSWWLAVERWASGDCLYRDRKRQPELVRSWAFEFSVAPDMFAFARNFDPLDGIDFHQQHPGQLAGVQKSIRKRWLAAVDELEGKTSG